MHGLSTTPILEVEGISQQLYKQRCVRWFLRELLLLACSEGAARDDTGQGLRLRLRLKVGVDLVVVGDDPWT